MTLSMKKKVSTNQRRIVCSWGERGGGSHCLPPYSNGSHGGKAMKCFKE